MDEQTEIAKLRKVNSQLLSQIEFCRKVNDELTRKNERLSNALGNAPELLDSLYKSIDAMQAENARLRDELDMERNTWLEKLLTMPDHEINETLKRAGWQPPADTPRADDTPTEGA